MRNNRATDSTCKCNSASLTEDEVTYLVAIFVQLGETLATIAACRGLANREEEEKK